MPCILLRESFIEENVPQMASAIRADNLGAISIGIGMSSNGPWNLIIKTWPTAVAIELGIRFVKWSVASTTRVSARFLVIGIFADASPLGALAKDHIRFGFVQWVVLDLV